MHALGALDLALWDIKGKALKLPVHELLGGSGAQLLRVLCHGRIMPRGSMRRRMSLRDRAARDDGSRLSRVSHGRSRLPESVRLFNTHERVRKVAQDCKEAREGVGPNGDWCIDFHQRFDYSTTRCAPAG